MTSASRCRCALAAALAVAIVAPTTRAGDHPFPFVLETGKAARRNRPVHVALPPALATKLPADLPATAAWIDGTVNGKSVTWPAQIERTGRGAILHFVLRRAEANETHRLTLHVDPDRTASPGSPIFRFDDKKGEHLDLMLGDAGVLRHMYARDEARHDETYKVFTHIYGYHGEPYITKGPGGKYTHHRGMFIGWNRATVGDTRYDFWHMKPKGTLQTHAGFDHELAGPALGRFTDRIDWTTAEGKTAIQERRTIAAAWQPPGQSLFDIEIELRSKAGTIRLEGDPQHAGFQVRAVQAVHDHAEDTLYFHPEGSEVKKNVVASGDWVTCTFELAGHPYAVMYFSHPSNPHRDTAILSIRQYARFGEYFPTDLEEGKPLHLKYRVVVMDMDRHGAMSPERIQAKYHDYIHPVKVMFAK